MLVEKAGEAPGDWRHSTMKSEPSAGDTVQETLALQSEQAVGGLAVVRWSNWKMS
jgi:hypothetical protein